MNWFFCAPAVRPDLLCLQRKPTEIIRGMKPTRLQLAYLLGYRRAKREYRRELREIAAQVDEELGSLQGELAELRRAATRLARIEEAAVVEREPGALLHKRVVVGQA